MTNNLKALWIKAWAAGERGQWMYGRLGRLSDDGATVTIQVPHRTTHVYVRMGANGDQGISEVRYRGNVALRPGLAVRMRIDGGELTLFETDAVVMGADPNAPVDGSGVAYHTHPAGTFTGLTDTPAAYTGAAGKVTTVNAGETALEFVATSNAIAGTVHAATLDTTPLDADEVPTLDSTSAAFTLQRTTWTSIKAFLKTYFDGLYGTITNVVLRSGTQGLTGDWDIGSGRKISAATLAARDAAGLTLQDDGGNEALRVVDGGALAITGNQYKLGNPAVAIWAATNTAIGGSAPRLVSVNLEMDYDGVNNVTVSAAIPLSGGDVLARDSRAWAVFIASVIFSSTGQSRRTVYAPQVSPATDGAYVALTAASTAVINTGYDYTLEISCSNGGILLIRVTRTGGVTTVAKIHVGLMLST